jgi:L-fuconate dehydratase
VRRARIIREEIGWQNSLMMDANQRWGVAEAVQNMTRLAEFKPLWIEEPTSPDDILGHAKIRQALKKFGIGIATGEAAHNRVMFKQFLQAEAMDFCQIDACRLGSVNEMIAVLLMAAKYQVPVCPHAGGVGLCEYVQHMAFFDFICISASKEGRVLEYVNHLHEHFVDPITVRGGFYQLPSRPGYSGEMLVDSLDRFEYPHGDVWQKLAQNTT